jgi:phosphate transport system protein
MAQHLQFEIARLNRRLLSVGEAVASTVQKSVTAILERRAPLAEEVIRGDGQIDTREVEIEEECLKLLALYQPVAQDLRFVASVMRINSDLERMGDEAVNIAEHAIFLAESAPLAFPPQLELMTAATMRMLLGSLDSFVKMDPVAARAICAEDDEVDEYNRQVIETVWQMVKQNPETIESATRLFSVSRHVERIADHATNIAEDVVYLVEGVIIRHQSVFHSQSSKPASAF